MSILISEPPAVAAFLEPSGVAVTRHPANRGRWRMIGDFVLDGLLVILAVLLIPIAILAIGVPIALAVWALIEIAQRFL